MELWAKLMLMLWIVSVVIGHDNPTISQQDSPVAQDCVIYDGQPKPDENTPIKTFNHRLSFSITALANIHSWVIELHSENTTDTCTILYTFNTIAASGTCHGEKPVKWPNDIIENGKTTDFWIQVGGDGEKGQIASSPLYLVGKKAGKRGHFQISNSGLKSPISIQFIQSENLQYYFNCITGCPYGKSATTFQVEDSYIYLRPSYDFQYLILNLTNDAQSDSGFNVTSADLGPIQGNEIRRIQAVFNSTKIVGIRLDDKLVGETGRLKKTQVTGEVTGGGLVSNCKDIFQEVAGDLDKTTQLVPSPQCHQDIASSGIILGMLLSIIFILIAIIVFLSITLAKSSGKLNVTNIFRRTTSSASNSTRRGSIESKESKRQGSFKDSKRQGSLKDSKRKGSFKDSKRKGDDVDCGSCSEVTAALSDTTMTPMNTPGSLSIPRSPNLLNSRELVSLDIMSD